MLRDVNHVVARHGVDGDRWHGDIYRQVMVNGSRVTRFVAHGRGHGHAAVAKRRNIRRRNVQRPAAVRADGCGVVFTVQAYGHRLARLGGAGAGHGQIALRFGRIENVVTRDRVDGHGRRGGVHAVLSARRRAVAVHVSDAHLYAGVAVFQTCQIARWHRGGPFTLSIHRGGIILAAKGNGDGLVCFHVRGGAGEHQIRALLGRVNHIV